MFRNLENQLLIFTFDDPRHQTVSFAAGFSPYLFFYDIGLNISKLISCVDRATQRVGGRNRKSLGIGLRA